MGTERTALERAFELARSGKCYSVMEIEKRLKFERHDASQVQGKGLRKQLLQLIRVARDSHIDPTPPIERTYKRLIG
jgi:hypothetical protein